MSFVLTPPAAGGSDLKPTPHFCGFRLSVVANTSDAVDPFTPVRYLRTERNPLYNGRQSERGKLYLRTSGSMGASKIVVHRHDKLFGNASNCAQKYHFSPVSRVMIPVPIAHMYGFGAEFLPAILSGAAIELQDKTNLIKYLDREKRFQPTIVFATPAICEMLLKGYKTPRKCYDVFVTSGQRIGDGLFRAFDRYVGGRLVNQYGSTEMGATAACDPGDDPDRRRTSIGEPMPGVRLRLDELREQTRESPGERELYCHHPYGFEGYVDEDGEWLQELPADGWYRTGDIAVARTDGSLEVIGRADASMNRRGYLVLLADIERVMEKLDICSEVVVVAGKDENRQGQSIAVFCVPRAGMVLSAAQLRERCFDVLPHYAIPDEVHISEQLPLLPSGKVDRLTLAAMIR
jgi:acyl-coenzyme A synthetase/AMP-(fatty) acid ligase